MKRCPRLLVSSLAAASGWQNQRYSSDSHDYDRELAGKQPSPMSDCRIECVRAQLWGHQMDTNTNQWMFSIGKALCRKLAARGCERV
jgi:hypothetical protein